MPKITFKQALQGNLSNVLKRAASPDHYRAEPAPDPNGNREQRRLWNKLHKKKT